MNLLGKTIVITGTARGLGFAAASKLKRLGATVIGLDILAPQDSGLLDAFYQVDLCDRHAVANVISAISTDFGNRLHNLQHRGLSSGQLVLGQTKR